MAFQSLSQCNVSLLTLLYSCLGTLVCAGSIGLGAGPSSVKDLNATNSIQIPAVPVTATSGNSSNSTAIRSSEWTWNVNVTTGFGTTKSVVSLAWPDGTGPGADNAKWDVCAVFLPTFGNLPSVLNNGPDYCFRFRENCSEALQSTISAQKDVLGPGCNGISSVSIPKECGGFDSYRVDSYSSSTLKNGAAFVYTTEDNVLLNVSMQRVFPLVLIENSREGGAVISRFSCLQASNLVAPVNSVGDKPGSASQAVVSWMIMIFGVCTFTLLQGMMI